MRRAGALTVAVLLAASPAAAQDPVANGTVFGDWTVVCAAEAVGRTVCALAQTLVDPADGALLAEIGLNPVGSGAEAQVVMVLRTPASMLLPVRPAFRVGEGPTVALTWHTCAGESCTALLTLGAEDIAALRRGLTMIVGYQPLAQDRPLSFPVSLRGITAGLAALGVP